MKLRTASSCTAESLSQSTNTSSYPFSAVNTSWQDWVEAVRQSDSCPTCANPTVIRSLSSADTVIAPATVIAASAAPANNTLFFIKKSSFFLPLPGLFVSDGIILPSISMEKYGKTSLFFSNSSTMHRKKVGFLQIFVRFSTSFPPDLPPHSRK